MVFRKNHQNFPRGRKLKTNPVLMGCETCTRLYVAIHLAPEFTQKHSSIKFPCWCYSEELFSKHQVLLDENNYQQTNFILCLFTPASLLFSHLSSHLQPLSLPWFIYTAPLQMLTWHFHSLLSSSLCVILSLSLYYSLYLSVPLPLCLLLSLIGTLSVGARVLLSLCLCASYRQCMLSRLHTLASSVCCRLLQLHM